jgi:DNA-binding CsgD family transcriptional regulator
MTDEQVVALYLELKDSQLVGIKAHCSPETVRNLVRAAGHPILPRGGLPDRHALQLGEDEICRRYRAGQSTPTIAQAAGTYPGKICRILRAHGVPVRDKTENGRMQGRKQRLERARQK